MIIIISVCIIRLSYSADKEDSCRGEGGKEGALWQCAFSAGLLQLASAKPDLACAQSVSIWYTLLYCNIFSMLDVTNYMYLPYIMTLQLHAGSA